MLKDRRKLAHVPSLTEQEGGEGVRETKEKHRRRRQTQKITQQQKERTIEGVKKERHLRRCMTQIQLETEMNVTDRETN